MKVFLAGCNGGRKDILIEAMGDDMIIYMAGAVGGNLKPMWQRATARMQDEDYETAVDNATTEFLNEDLFRREHDIPLVGRSDAVRGFL